MGLVEEKRKSYLGTLIGSVLTLAVLAALAYGFYWYFSQPRCNIPINYSINSVDSKFQINRQGFTDVANQAANEWNKQTGLDIFKFDSTAKLKLNMVYDSRQATIDQIEGQAATLQNQKSSLDSQNTQFESLLQEYKDRLAKYNSEVDYYNSHGGAPPSEYAALNQEQQSLKQLQRTLNDMATNLNRQADLYNADVSTLQQNIDQNANKIITQGEYDPNSDTINIYTYGGKNELEFVLMHEMGHALGLDHVSDSSALMYAMVQSQDINNPTLTPSDLSEMERVCNFQHRFTFPTFQDLKNLFSVPTKQT